VPGAARPPAHCPPRPLACLPFCQGHEIWRPFLAPWSSNLELGRQPKERRLVRITTLEVHADRQAIGVPREWYRHRRLTRRVGCGCKRHPLEDIVSRPLERAECPERPRGTQGAEGGHGCLLAGRRLERTVTEWRGGSHRRDERCGCLREVS